MAKFSEHLEINGIDLRCEGVYTPFKASQNYFDEDEHFELTLEEIYHNREDIIEIISEKVENEIIEKLTEILNN